MDEQKVEISTYSAWTVRRHEVIRVVVMLALIVALFYPDWSALRTMSYVMGVFLGVALIAHITRKYALFPYVDLRELYNRARTQRCMASAVVFASVCGVIIACVVTAAKFFVH